MEKISIVVPCYNEEEAISYFYEEINKVMNEMNFIEFEVIFVNDGSKDKTLEKTREIAKKDNRFRYLSFSRNFGKDAAMYAGLKNVTGDYAAIMDVDLQDPPTLLPQMYKAIKEEGYDCVAPKRTSRKKEKRPIKSFCSKVFYKTMNKMSNVPFIDGERDFRLMTKQMYQSVLELSEYNRYSKGILDFVGYNTKWIEYDDVERVAGETTYPFWKLIKYGIEGMTAFSTTPLVISSILGMLFCIIAFILIVIIIIKTLVYGDPTSGWPSLACIVFFVGGIQLFSIGIIGEYVAKTYLEVKKRPIYIVKETEKDLK